MPLCFSALQMWPLAVLASLRTEFCYKWRGSVLVVNHASGRTSCPIYIIIIIEPGEVYIIIYVLAAAALGRTQYIQCRYV